MTKTAKILGIIPARYGSTRFPGKPLVDIHGKSMIERVYEQSKKASLADDVIVATDDERIEKAVINFGGKVIMTSPAHLSGTDRCVEVIQKIGGTWDIIINIQGDEPLIFPEQINQVARCFDKKDALIATLIKVIQREEDLHNPNVVKAVINNRNKALYFSRAAVPFNRHGNDFKGQEHIKYYKHIGIYGYRTDILLKIAALPQSNLELAEALEQLRWMENGFEITTAVTTYDNIAIDSPDDLVHVLKIIESRQ